MKLSLSTLALALAATPLAAQITTREPRPTTRGRIETVQDAIEAARRGSGDVSRDDSRTTARGSSQVPRGHLPPRGMCRVWIDGVPPGQQPPVTTCAQAERDRFRYSNARVIYGDRDSFPGKGKGKFKKFKHDDRDDHDHDRERGASKSHSKAMKAQARAARKHGKG